ncbi:MAG: SDR family oxidoreductase [Nocardioidaceae bacterium]|nr:SDR family oxidoreductase [Nocardioidaceae bacterium]
MTRASLDGSRAVVTGSAGKLGPVWVGALLAAGADVTALVLEDTQDDVGLAKLADQYGSSLDILVADVSSRADLEAALVHMERKGGPPAVLVNNAGIDQPPVPGAGELLEHISATTFLRIVEVNTVGAFQAMQVVGAAMARAGHGSIVNVGSIYATVSPDMRMYDHLQTDPPFLKPPAYGASKAGLLNLSRYFATHLAPHGVRVNSLSPGGVMGTQDEQFLSKFSARVPLGRLARPDELVGPLLFLASDDSSYVTGIDLKVDGGFTAW